MVMTNYEQLLFQSVALTRFCSLAIIVEVLQQKPFCCAMHAAFAVACTERIPSASQSHGSDYRYAQWLRIYVFLFERY